MSVDANTVADAEVDADTTDERDKRALTEVMSILDYLGRVRGTPGLYLVVSTPDASLSSTLTPARVSVSTPSSSCTGVIASVTVTGPSTAIVSLCGCTVPPDLIPELGSDDTGAE